MDLTATLSLIAVCISLAAVVIVRIKRGRANLKGSHNGGVTTR